MGNIFSSSCRRCCEKYEGLDETNTKNVERSSVDGNQPIESTEYTNLVTMTAKFVYIDRLIEPGTERTFYRFPHDTVTCLGSLKIGCHLK